MFCADNGDAQPSIDCSHLSSLIAMLSVDDVVFGSPFATSSFVQARFVGSFVDSLPVRELRPAGRGDEGEDRTTGLWDRRR
jgi:hypothetical protein